MSSARKMPDGSICWTGSACKRHGSYYKKGHTMLSETSYVIDSTPTSPPEKIDDWMKEIITKKHALYCQIYNTIGNNVTFDDEELNFRSTPRVGINGTNTTKMKQIDLESVQLRMEITKEAEDTLSHYQSSYEFVNAYLREGREGINKLAYLQRTSPHPTKPNHVSEETLDRYEHMAKTRIKALDETLHTYGRQNSNNQILHRAIFIPEQNLLSPAEYAAKHYPVGKIVEEKSYISTSTDSDYMLAFNPKNYSNQIVFEIKTNKGTVLHDPNDSVGSIGMFEREILLPRNMKFKVVNILETTYQSSYTKTQKRELQRKNSNIKFEQKFTVIQLEETK